MRARFLLLLALAGCAEHSAMVDTPTPVLYHNATFWTGDPDRPAAEALLAEDGTILGVGSVAELEDRAGSSVVREDLGGAFAMPGFIDNHVHFLTGGFQLASVDLRDASSRDDFAARIAAFARELAGGDWVLGGGWDHERWGGHLPERTWIDDLTGDTPVFVTRLDLHMGLANSAALRLAGINATTADPAGGTIVRGADGTPTGILKDEAMGLVQSVIPPPSQDDFDRALERALQHAASLGITQVHDVGSYGGWTDLNTFERARDRGALTVRIYSMAPVTDWERLRDRIAELGRGDEWLWWGGLKGFVDGSLGSTTAWFYEPYEDEPGTSGLVVTDTTELAQNIRDAAEEGLHLAIHAIGDRANDWLLDVYAGLQSPGASRHRIEHAQHLTMAAIPRFAELGVVPSAQPYHAADDGRWAQKRIGETRIQTTYPFRSLLEAGAMLTFGSDWTVAPLSPLLGVEAAVMRQTIDGANPNGWVPEQRVSVEQALAAYTRSNAFAGFSDEFTGTLRPGKRVDLAILDRDPREARGDSISKIRVLRTIVDGRTVFRAQPEGEE